ncbi:MAG: hypothetical protein AAGF60_08185 [Pseudomonadota bacterium]
MILRWLKWLMTPQVRPLSAARPALGEREVPLGLEAIDTRMIESVNRRNQALERTYNPITQRTRRFGALENADTDSVVHFADDETYASRFHAAFQAKDTRR